MLIPSWPPIQPREPVAKPALLPVVITVDVDTILATHPAPPASSGNAGVATTGWRGWMGSQDGININRDHNGKQRRRCHWLLAGGAGWVARMVSTSTVITTGSKAGVATTTTGWWGWMGSQDGINIDRDHNGKQRRLCHYYWLAGLDG